MRQQISLWNDERLALQDAIELSLASLREYGQRYRHWAVAYSGGKDSSATVTFVAWAIRNNLVPRPESLLILYGDTLLEIPPLHDAAMYLLGQLREEGFDTRIAVSPLDDQFFVYMLGRGVPPPKNKFRWCTEKMKIKPNEEILFTEAVRLGMGEMVYDPKTKKDVYKSFGEEKFLLITGVRLGESEARDQRIALSCNKDSGECGQGWFQVATPESVADTLAPIIHWRVCHVYDWDYFETARHGYNISQIAVVYGDGDVRTGCMGCPLVSRDVSLERLVKKPDWKHLMPLLELKPLWMELNRPRHRLRKSDPEPRKNGRFGVEDNLKKTSVKLDLSLGWDELKEQVKKLPKKKKQRDNTQRLGPLTMAARAYGLERVLDIQRRSGVLLINPEQEARIRELWALDTWPQRWDGNELTGDVLIDAKRVTDAGEIAVQALLVR